MADGSIALPVTADEEFTCLNLGGGCEGACGLLGRVGSDFGGGVGEHCCYLVIEKDCVDEEEHERVEKNAEFGVMEMLGDVGD